MPSTIHIADMKPEIDTISEDVPLYYVSRLAPPRTLFGLIPIVPLYYGLTALVFILLGPFMMYEGAPQVLFAFFSILLFLTLFSFHYGNEFAMRVLALFELVIWFMCYIYVIASIYNFFYFKHQLTTEIMYCWAIGSIATYRAILGLRLYCWLRSFLEEQRAAAHNLYSILEAQF